MQKTDKTVINNLAIKVVVSLIAILTLGLSTQAFAVGSDTSDLYGTVSGMTGSDWTITATDPRTGRTVTRSVGADGSYRFSEMAPGVYDVTVRQAGEPVVSSPVKVSLGQNIAADFDVTQTASTLEEVIVTGSAVRLAVDVTSTDSGLVLGEMEVDAMPVARNPTAVALLAPGVVLGDTGFGNTASMGGASVAENVCVINGLEVTNTRQGLGCSSVPFEFYKEFQVKTGGYSAEFGRATGGLLNAVTKSGGNEWEFFAQAIWQPSSLYESGQFSRGNGSTGDIFRDERNDERSSKELAFSVSGPIWQDHLFIYALVNPRDTELKYAYEGPVTADQYVGVKEYRVRTSDGADNLFWGVKLDWLITEGHTLSYFGYSDRNDSEELVFSYDPETETIGSESTGGFLRKRGGTAHSFSYVGYLTDRLTISALAGRIEAEYTTDPLNTECPTVNDNRANPNPRAVSCGPGGSIGDNNDENTQYRLDIGYDIGNHQLKAGIDVQERASTRITTPVAGHSYVYDTLAPNGVIQGDLGPIYTNNTGADLDYVQDRIFVGGGNFKQDMEAFYIEDNWQIMDRLMLSIGLRWDDFKSYGTTNKVLTDFSTDVAPRLGFSWDVKGDGRQIVRGGYGTYYDFPYTNATILFPAAAVQAKS